MQLPTSIYKIPVGEKDSIFLQLIGFYLRYCKKFSVFTLIIISSVIFASFILILKTGNDKVSLIQDRETEILISTISRFIAVPKDEIPTVVTVSDPDTVKNRFIFSGAKMGDKIIVYPKAKKAILYSAELKKVTEVTSVIEQ